MFIIYMIDGIYQSAVIYFIIQYAYFSPTARSDGYGVALYEFSTTMAIAAVMVANLCNGLNTSVWTGWVFFATFIGIVLVWIYTAVYSLISPGWFVTPVYGNDAFLFPSAYFWLCLPITILFSLLPRYLAKALKFGYMPDDIDIVRWNRKVHPERDLGHDAYFAAPLAAMRRSNSIRRSADIHHSTARATSRPVSIASRADSVTTLDLRRAGMEQRSGSRTDMSTGQHSVHRGFDFATEEGGVAMLRMQSNLSERRQSSRNLPLSEAQDTKKKSALRLFSLRRTANKKPSSPNKSSSCRS
jgi:phospholipid-translocating ATPase